MRKRPTEALPELPLDNCEFNKLSAIYVANPPSSKLKLAIRTVIEGAGKISGQKITAPKRREALRCGSLLAVQNVSGGNSGAVVGWRFCAGVSIYESTRLDIELADLFECALGGATLHQFCRATADLMVLAVAAVEHPEFCS